MNRKRFSVAFLLTVLISGCIPNKSSFKNPSQFDILLRDAGVDRSIRFAVIGDYGSAGSPGARVAELVADWEPDFILTTGDNNYPKGKAETIENNIEQYYGDYIVSEWELFNSQDQENRFFPSLGNHDLLTEAGRPYFDYFHLPGNERYYHVRFDSIEFFILNSNQEELDGNTEDSFQALWLQNALKSSDADWKLIIFHHAPYSSGKHGPTRDLQWPFDEWGVDIVISGHDHTYERLTINGLTYVVNGLGGRSRYAFKQIHPGSQIRYNDRNGALFARKIDASLNFWFVNVHGEIVDSFTLSKH